MPVSDTSPFATLERQALPRFDRQAAFAAYEAARHHFPSARFCAQSNPVADLGALADAYDVFVFDAFGVLNVGETAIPGAIARIEALRSAGKTCLILSNAASYDQQAAEAKFRRLGFAFSASEIVTSRQAAIEALEQSGLQKGLAVLGLAPGETGALPFEPVFPRTDDELDAASGFLFLSTLRWGMEKQDRLEASLRRRRRPVVIANPDIIAPREDGLSTEPGFFGYRLAALDLADVDFHGKPFPSVYGLVQRRFPPDADLRICMIGDTLHTDVLGAAAAGWKTVLATDYGMLTGQDIEAAIRISGIRPDHILPSI